MTDMTLTLPKADLLNELNARLTEIDNTVYAEEIKEIKAALKNVITSATVTKALVKYHKDIAKGLDDGSITLSTSGRLQNAPAKPATGSILVPQSVRRLYGYGRSEYTTEEDLKTQLAHYEKNVAQYKKPVEAAIKLLNLSTDTEVVIKSADYQALLSGPTRY